MGNSKDNAGNNFYFLYLTKLQSNWKFFNHKVIVLAVCQIFRTIPNEGLVYLYILYNILLTKYSAV